MKVAAPTARSTHCLTSSFQIHQLGALESLPSDCVYLCLSEVSLKQPQMNEGALLVWCFPGMRQFGSLLSVWLLSVGFGGVVAS